MNLMTRCLISDPSYRPTATDLVRRMDVILMGNPTVRGETRFRLYTAERELVNEILRKAVNELKKPEKASA